MMSSRLGSVAPVIATESPSHESPVVIQMTWAVTASVCGLVVYELGRHLASSRQQIRGSGSPASRSITRLPPKAVSTSTIPGGSVLTSPISAASSHPGTERSAAQRRVGPLGRHEGHEPALVRHVHRVDPQKL